MIKSSLSYSIAWMITTIGEISLGMNAIYGQKGYTFDNYPPLKPTNMEKASIRLLLLVNCFMIDAIGQNQDLQAVQSLTFSDLDVFGYVNI